MMILNRTINLSDKYVLSSLDIFMQSSQSLLRKITVTLVARNNNLA